MSTVHDCQDFYYRSWRQSDIIVKPAEKGGKREKKRERKGMRERREGDRQTEGGMAQGWHSIK